MHKQSCRADRLAACRRPRRLPSRHRRQPRAPLELALATDDTLAVVADRGGETMAAAFTAMARGCKVSRCTGTSSIARGGKPELLHRSESVTLLPPLGFRANDRKSYAPITHAAVSTIEIAQPDRQRAFHLLSPMTVFQLQSPAAYRNRRALLKVEMSRAGSLISRTAPMRRSIAKIVRPSANAKACPSASTSIVAI